MKLSEIIHLMYIAAVIMWQQEEHNGGCTCDVTLYFGTHIQPPFVRKYFPLKHTGKDLWTQGVSFTAINTDFNIDVKSNPNRTSNRTTYFHTHNNCNRYKNTHTNATTLPSIPQFLWDSITFWSPVDSIWTPQPMFPSWEWLLLSQVYRYG